MAPKAKDPSKREATVKLQENGVKEMMATLTGTKSTVAWFRVAMQMIRAAERDKAEDEWAALANASGMDATKWLTRVKSAGHTWPRHANDELEKLARLGAIAPGTKFAEVWATVATAAIGTETGGAQYPTSIDMNNETLPELLELVRLKFQLATEKADAANYVGNAAERAQARAAEVNKHMPSYEDTALLLTTAIDTLASETRSRLRALPEVVALLRGPRPQDRAAEQAAIATAENAVAEFFREHRDLKSALSMPRRHVGKDTAKPDTKAAATGAGEQKRPRPRKTIRDVLGTKAVAKYRADHGVTVSFDDCFEKKLCAACGQSGHLMRQEHKELERAVDKELGSYGNKKAKTNSVSLSTIPQAAARSAATRGNGAGDDATDSALEPGYDQLYGKIGLTASPAEQWILSMVMLDTGAGPSMIGPTLAKALGLKLTPARWGRVYAEVANSYTDLLGEATVYIVGPGHESTVRGVQVLAQEPDPDAPMGLILSNRALHSEGRRLGTQVSNGRLWWRLDEAQPWQAAVQDTGGARWKSAGTRRVRAAYAATNEATMEGRAETPAPTPITTHSETATESDHPEAPATAVAEGPGADSPMETPVGAGQVATTEHRVGEGQVATAGIQNQHGSPVTATEARAEEDDDSSGDDDSTPATSEGKGHGSPVTDTEARADGSSHEGDSATAPAASDSTEHARHVYHNTAINRDRPMDRMLFVCADEARQPWTVVVTGHLVDDEGKVRAMPRAALAQLQAAVDALPRKRNKAAATRGSAAPGVGRPERAQWRGQRRRGRPRQRNRRQPSRPIIGQRREPSAAATSTGTTPAPGTYTGGVPDELITIGEPNDKRTGVEDIKIAKFAEQDAAWFLHKMEPYRSLYDGFGKKQDDEKGPPAMSEDSVVADIMLIPGADARSLYSRMRRYSEEQRDELKRRAGEWLAAELLEHSKSSSASMPVLTRKKDGTWRINVDFRLVNANTAPDRYAMPVMSDLVVKAATYGTVTVSDGFNAYYQIPLARNARDLTATAFGPGIFCNWTRGAMGLRNMPAILQRFTDQKIIDVHDDAMAYIDDIIIGHRPVERDAEGRAVDETGRPYGYDKEASWAKMKPVFDRMLAHGYRMAAAKTILVAAVVPLLGVVVGPGWHEPPADRVRKLLETPMPADKASLSNFVGAMRFYNAYVPTMARVTKPLNVRRTKDGNKFVMTPEMRDAVEEAKTALAAAVRLEAPTRQAEYRMDADYASITNSGGGVVSFREPGETTGGTVIQVNLPGPPHESAGWRPFAYHAIQFKDTKTPMHAAKGENRVLYETLRAEPALRGRQITVGTDSKLVYERLAGSSGEKIDDDELRWLALVAEAAVRVEHIKAVVPDWLSRNPRFGAEADRVRKELGGGSRAMSRRERQRDQVEPKAAATAAQPKPLRELIASNDHRSDWQAELTADPTLAAARNAMASRTQYDDDGTAMVLAKDSAGLTWARVAADEDAPARLVVPQGHRQRLVALAHAHTGHKAAAATSYMVATKLWWPAMSRDVRNWVQSCEPCAKVRAIRTRGIMGPSETQDAHRPIHRNEWLGLDVVTVGDRKWLSITDAATTFMWLRGLASRDADAMVRQYALHTAAHGQPAMVTLDREFSKALGEEGSDDGADTVAGDGDTVWDRYLASVATQVRPTPAHEPNPRSFYERVHKDLRHAYERLDQQYGSSMTTELKVATALAGTNAAPGSDGGPSAYRRYFGEDMRLPYDAWLMAALSVASDKPKNHWHVGDAQLAATVDVTAWASADRVLLGVEEAAEQAQAGADQRRQANEEWRAKRLAKGPKFRVGDRVRMRTETTAEKSRVWVTGLRVDKLSEHGTTADLSAGPQRQFKAISTRRIDHDTAPPADPSAMAGSFWAQEDFALFSQLPKATQAHYQGKAQEAVRWAARRSRGEILPTVSEAMQDVGRTMAWAKQKLGEAAREIAKLLKQQRDHQGQLLDATTAKQRNSKRTRLTQIRKEMQDIERDRNDYELLIAGIRNRLLGQAEGAPARLRANIHATLGTSADGADLVGPATGSEPRRIETRAQAKRKSNLEPAAGQRRVKPRVTFAEPAADGPDSNGPPDASDRAAAAAEVPDIGHRTQSGRRVRPPPSRD